jgi:hypothetical protein
MSSYFDDASLVMIPSGYKTSKVYSVKPTDGTGDLAFTRSNDTATRVGPDGLIEKVRTNLLTYSNTFSNAAWIKTDSSVTSGQSGYDGTNNAWLLANTASSGNLTQAISFSGFNTLSFYAKAGTHQNLFILFNGSGFNATASYNLSTGVISNASADALITTATSVGNGWWRLTITGSRSNVDVRFYPSNNNTGGATTNGNILIQNIQLEAGDIATDYIATTSAAVSVGPVANVPRLDYLNSSCPRLLLEPQRTNLALYSEQFSNAAWTKRSNIAVTSNAITAPDGTLSADKIAASDNATVDYGVFDVVTSGLNTYSVFAKKGELNYVFVGKDNSFANDGVYFNLNTGAISSNPSSYSATITDYGNGWYRCSVYFATNVSYFFINPSVNGTSFTFSGQSGNGIYIWGAQAEVGAYATSYIPTLGAAVTRGADAASKSSINALIGGTSGTIFFEIKTNKTLTSTNYKQFFYYTDASSAQAYMYLNGSNTLVLNPSLGNISSSINLAANTTYKIAVAYATNDFKLYINGVERGSSTSGTSINAVNLLSLGSYQGTSEFNEFVFSQYIHFQTRLSNSDLAALTA